MYESRRDICLSSSSNWLIISSTELLFQSTSSAMLLSGVSGRSSQHSSSENVGRDPAGMDGYRSYHKPPQTRYLSFFTICVHHTEMREFSNCQHLSDAYNRWSPHVTLDPMPILANSKTPSMEAPHIKGPCSTREEIFTPKSHHCVLIFLPILHRLASSDWKSTLILVQRPTQLLYFRRLYVTGRSRCHFVYILFYYIIIKCADRQTCLLYTSPSPRD